MSDSFYLSFVTVSNKTGMAHLKFICIYVHGRLFIYQDQMDIKATGVCQSADWIPSHFLPRIFTQFSVKCICIYVHGRLFIYQDQMDIKSTGVCQCADWIPSHFLPRIFTQFAVSRANPLCCPAHRLLLTLFVTNFAYCRTTGNSWIHAATAYLTTLSVGQVV